MLLCQLCALPDQQVEVRQTLPGEDAAEYACRACGVYRLEREWVEADVVTTLKPEDAVRLCGVVRADTDRKGLCAETITLKNFRDILARHQQPKSPLEQLERLVVYYAEHSAHVGARCIIDDAYALARRLYLLPLNANMNALLNGASKTGYFDVNTASHPTGLSLQGWQLAERLRAEVREFDQAFVAMWFHEGMDEAFKLGFDPGLRACGYNPLRIDQTAPAGKIDDEIIASIRKSRLLVADLTGCRPNVFYEAGFAHGLGRSVIYTCHESYVGYFLPCAPTAPEPPEPVQATWFDQISKHAFDVRQYPVLHWQTPADLATRLQARVEARGLSLKI